jgi:hypothetical protein
MFSEDYDKDNTFLQQATIRENEEIEEIEDNYENVLSAKTPILFANLKVKKRV